MNLIDLESDKDYILDGRYAVKAKDKCPTKVVAQVKVDTDEIMERIKEEYEIFDIVRCEDCIYCDKGGRVNMCTGLPLKTGYSFEMSVFDDDYCSFGKKKREE